TIARILDATVGAEGENGGRVVRYCRVIVVFRRPCRVSLNHVDPVSHLCDYPAMLHAILTIAFHLPAAQPTSILELTGKVVSVAAGETLTILDAEKVQQRSACTASTRRRRDRRSGRRRKRRWPPPSTKRLSASCGRKETNTGESSVTFTSMTATSTSS